MTISPRSLGRWLVGVAAGGAVGLGGPAFGQLLPAPTEPPVFVTIQQAQATSTPAAPAISPIPVVVLPSMPAIAPPAPEIAPPAAPAIVPPPAAAAAPLAAECPPCDACEDVRNKVPPVRPYPRPGFFPILPTGPGYYSLADALTGNRLEGPPRYPYPRFGLMPPSFFDADFRYLDDPANTETDFFDPLKRVRIGDDWLFSTGGSTWNRYMNEYNSRLTESNNVYNLTRARVYGDLWYRDSARLFAEFIGAYSAWEDLPSLPIDENKADFQNLFLDLKVAELGGRPAYVRVGRQELLYGSQRLISPPDWANTRRTFQGVKAFRQGENFDVDLFWVQPVIPDANRLDSVDNNQNFAGVWTTYRPRAGRTIDLYYLLLDNTNRIVQQGIDRGNFTLHTFGSRTAGDVEGRFLWDFEGAVQLGSTGGRDTVAGMAAGGVGYHWKDAPLTPTAWAMYDYASGDSDPTSGDVHTFNQLFPFGHYYFGWADLVGRQNIHDLNFHLYAYPAKWLTVWLQYHNFWLVARRDALYGIAGQAYRRDPTGRAGYHVGQELDLILNFHLTKHADLLTGYSHLFGGEFLRNTAGPNRAVDSGLFYIQLGYRW